jgi:hypothetical protein
MEAAWSGSSEWYIWSSHLSRLLYFFNQSAIFMKLSTKVTLSNSIPCIIPKPH